MFMGQGIEDRIIMPEAAVLELTYRCNHSCVFCSCPWEAPSKDGEGYAKGKEMGLAQWKEALVVLDRLGVKNITISGGEALLYPHLLELLDHIRAKTNFNAHSEIVLISNGLAMDMKFLEAFKKYDVHLSMSLPGIQTFARHTGVDNAQGVLHSFGEAQKKGINTTLNVTVTSLNHYELFQTLAIGLLSGAGSVLVNRFLPGGRGLGHVEELMLNREQIVQMLDTTEAVLEYSERTGTMGTEVPLCVVGDEGKYKRLNIATICSAAKDFFVVDPSGFIRVCNHSPKKVGHIFDNPVISDEKYWNIFAKRAYIPSGCVSCADVSYCDCGCREASAIMSGSVSAPDPLF